MYRHNLLQVTGAVEVMDPNSEAARITHAGQVIGTPPHMSPEQASGQYASHGPETDIWGLGVLLYECLTGRLPLGVDLAPSVSARCERGGKPNSVAPAKRARLSCRARHVVA